MCTCEICGTLFSARQQVKNPRACNRLSCQKARQAKNESEWHQRNRTLYLQNAKYHQEQRIVRHKNLSTLADRFLVAVLLGFTFKGISIDQNIFSSIFSDFIHSIGLRQINKFYQEKNTFQNVALPFTT